MRLRLSAKPSTAERRQTLCAVQTLSGFPQRSFPAHKRAIAHFAHKIALFRQAEPRPHEMGAARVSVVPRGRSARVMTAVLPPSAPPYTIRLCLGQGSGVRPGCAGFRCRETAGPDCAVPKRILRPPECPARPAAASGPAFRFPGVLQRCSLYSWQPRNHWPSAALPVQ